MTQSSSEADITSGDDVTSDEVVNRLLAQADSTGRQLVGPGGLLTQLTQKVLERALDTEMADHLGYEPGDRAGVGSGNSRNGRSRKTVLTDIGPVEVSVPRDRNGTFTPQAVRKRQRRLDGLNDAIVSLYARGMTVRDIRAHLNELYGVDVSPDLVSKVTDAVAAEIGQWQNRALEPVWAVMFVDAMWVKIRDGVVTNRPVYVVVGVDFTGAKHVLGLWIGKDGEGAKYWMAVLAELRNRGVTDVCCACCDGLPRLPQAVTAVWPEAIVQTCVVHLIRGSMRYASKRNIALVNAGLNRSTPHPPCKPPPTHSTPSKTASSADGIRRSSGCVVTPGPSSHRSWPTPNQSVGSSTPPT
ncbi:hypothetical protein Pen02_19080 [Plantactinospora endophytica]|uniref:Mutator family transposase n=1 Tax=Plantactinospora endophytica TaxID=673535 RepID=A0ABQ4DXY9_9ACTN|nr:hypothetical protein Pen02_19080 [Plantactinospora endophytica]